MKNSIKRLSLAFLMGFSALMASCGDEVAESSSSVTESNQQSSTSQGELDHDANFHQYINDSAVKLGLDYKGHTFLADGIEQVSLLHKIDGDTAHFTPKSDSNTTIKSRFYGIDTPESTGAIQPWGKAASNFTGGMLEEANKNGTIVVASAQYQYGEPEFDSTGSRYLSIIWISLDTKDAPFDDLICLNLYIVQEGYSYVKNLSAMTTYVDTFTAAETQAKNYKLHLFSSDPDPLYNYGDYEDVSLLELKKELLLSMADSSHENKYDNAKVRVVGTVAGFVDHTIYLTDWNYYTDEDGNYVDNNGNSVNDPVVNPGVTGEYCGINIYTGMSAIPSKYTAKGAYIQVCGTASDSENFGFQISGATFPVVSYSENDAKVILSPAANTDEHALHTFEYTASELTAIANSYSSSSVNSESLYCSVSVTDAVEITRYYDATSGGEMTLYSSENWRIFIPFTYTFTDSEGKAQWSSGANFVGKKIKVTGVLTFSTNSKGNTYWQLCPSTSSDIVIVE